MAYVQSKDGQPPIPTEGKELYASEAELRGNVSKNISDKTLKKMDASVTNFKADKISEPVDLSDFN